MKEIETIDGDEVTVYEDTQSGDTISQHDRNTSREEKFERILDYFREPEDRVYDEEPEEPEVVKKVRELWKDKPIGSKAGKEHPETPEERRKKLKLFWETGKVMDEFYDETGHSTRQCPQCGWYTLEKVKECAKTSRIYEGCGYEFDEVRDRGYATEQALEYLLGELDENQPLYAFIQESGKGWIVASRNQSKAENRLCRQQDVDSLEELDIETVEEATLDHFEIVERNNREEVEPRDGLELLRSIPVTEEDGKFKRITQYKVKQEFPTEPVVKGLHQWKTLKKIKQFYWMFPNGPLTEKPEEEDRAGYYSTEVSWFFNYDFASFFNGRAWIMPLYWEMVEEAKEAKKQNDSAFTREERRQRIRDQINKFSEEPRKNFLTKQKYRKYSEY